MLTVQRPERVSPELTLRKAAQVQMPVSYSLLFLIPSWMAKKNISANLNLLTEGAFLS